MNQCDGGKAVFKMIIVKTQLLKATLAFTGMLFTFLPFPSLIHLMYLVLTFFPLISCYSLLPSCSHPSLYQVVSEFPCISQISSISLHPFPSHSLPLSLHPLYLPPSILLPPSCAAVGLLDSCSPMLSCSRAKPEQRAH